MAAGTPHATSCVLAMAMFAISVTVCEIITVEICMILTLTFNIQNGPKSNINRPMKKPYATSYLSAIAMFDNVCHHLRDIRSQNVNDLDLDR